jgi:hypothetical protein
LVLVRHLKKQLVLTVRQVKVSAVVGRYAWIGTISSLAREVFYLCVRYEGHAESICSHWVPLSLTYYTPYPARRALGVADCVLTPFNFPTHLDPLASKNRGWGIAENRVFVVWRPSLISENLQNEQNQKAAVHPKSQFPSALDHVVLSNGVAGKALRKSSGNPKNYEEIIAKADFPLVQLNAMFFVPVQVERIDGATAHRATANESAATDWRKRRPTSSALACSGFPPWARSRQAAGSPRLYSASGRVGAVAMPQLSPPTPLARWAAIAWFRWLVSAAFSFLESSGTSISTFDAVNVHAVCYV